MKHVWYLPQTDDLIVTSGKLTRMFKLSRKVFLNRGINTTSHLVYIGVY